MANLLSRTNERRPLRAALLGAAAIAVAGVLTVEALPVASHPALAAASTLSAGPASFADVVDRVKGAVVSVKVKIDQSNVAFDEQFAADADAEFPKGGPLEKFFRQFGERGGQERGGQEHQQPHMGMAQGSGFFISADGYIVTNNHVVDHAKDVRSPRRWQDRCRARSSALTRRRISRCSKSRRASDFPFCPSLRRRRASATGWSRSAIRSASAARSRRASCRRADANRCRSL